MATQTVDIYHGEAGLTLRAQVVNNDTGVTFAANVSLTQTAAGVYRLTLTNSAGVYRIGVEDTLDGNFQLGLYFVKTKNITKTYAAVSDYSLLPSDYSQQINGGTDDDATVAHLTRLLNTGLSGQVMIDGQMVNIDPAEIRRRLAELRAEAGQVPTSGIISFDLSSIGGRSAI